MAAENPDMAAEKGLIDRAYTKSLILPDIMRLVQNTHPEVSLSVNFGSAFRLILRYLDNPGQIAAFIDCHLDDTIKDLHGLLNTSGDQHVKDVSCLGSERALEMVKKIHQLFILARDPLVGEPAFLVSFDKEYDEGYIVDLENSKLPSPRYPLEKLKERFADFVHDYAEVNYVLYMDKETMQALEIASKDKGSAEPEPKRHKASRGVQVKDTGRGGLSSITAAAAKEIVGKPPPYVHTESGEKKQLLGLWVKGPDPCKPVLRQLCSERPGCFLSTQQLTLQEAAQEILHEKLKARVNGVLVVEETLNGVLEKAVEFLQNMP